MTNKIQFKISINKEYKLKCSYINAQNEEIIIPEYTGLIEYQYITPVVEVEE